VKCKGLFAELADYLDEMLDPALRAEIEEHLSNCKNCRIVVNTTKKTVEIFCNSEPVALPADTRERLHLALERRLRRVQA
jgi:predicted anti-sigma-YlaC factor YlaD